MTLVFYADLPPHENESEHLVKKTTEKEGARVTSSYGLGLDERTVKQKTILMLDPDAEEEEEEEEVEEEEKGCAEKESEFTGSAKKDRSVNGAKKGAGESPRLEKVLGDAAAPPRSKEAKDASQGNSPTPSSPSPAVPKDNEGLVGLMRFILNDNYLCLLFSDFTAWFSMMSIITVAFPFGTT